MRASKNTAFGSGFCALLLRTDESARLYAPAERCYCCTWCYYLNLGLMVIIIGFSGIALLLSLPQHYSFNLGIVDINVLIVTLIVALLWLFLFS